MPYIDKLYISHLPSLFQSDKLTFQPCPTNLDKLDAPLPKKYEMSFIGSNYSADRLKSIKQIANICNVTVFGGRWENFGIKIGGRIAFEEFPKVVAESHFCLGSLPFMFCEWSGNHHCLYNKTKVKGLCIDESCSDYSPKHGYFSNRVMNLCGSGGAVLMYNSKGIDDIFTDGHDAIFYKDLNDLSAKINHYRKNLGELQEIGHNAYITSKKHTFNIVAQSIIQ